MEWLRKIIVPQFDDEELNRQAFNLNVILLTTLVVMLLGIVAMLLQVGQRPPSYIIPNTLFISVAALILGVSYYLARQGRVRAGSVLFLVMMTIVCVGAVVVGGVQGALPVILIIPIATASVTLGSGVSLALAFLGLATLVITGLLEINGILNIAYPEPQATILLNMFDVGFGFFFVTMVTWLAGYSLRQALGRTQQAAAEADQYRQDLEQSLATEQAIRDRLQRAISEYASFLERFGQGDYAARLSLTEDDESLTILEQQINATVDTLAGALARSEAALEEVEAAQRRYVRRSWGEYVHSRTAADFEVARPGVMVPTDKLLPALREAIAQRRILTLTGRNSREERGETEPYNALVVPIMLRGEVIGSLGICREAGERTWTEEEQAMIDAVAERLALAAESLRLFENVQRRAAREQLAREITDKMRRAADMDRLLQTTVQEMAAALNTSNAFVQLSVLPEAVENEGEKET